MVRAIAASAIPIVSAVGHQTDYTLTDFVVDRRVATPSQAAEFVVPDVRELITYINTLKHMLLNNAHNVLKNKRLRVQQSANSRVLQYPHEFLMKRQQLLDSWMERLDKSIKQIIMVKRHQFEITAEKLAMLNPLAVLARGYSIVRDDKGQSVNNVSAMQPGQQLEIILNNGVMDVEVICVQEGYYGKSQEERES